MDPMWGIIIGAAAGGLLLEIWRTVKLYKNDKSPEESQALAITSIIMGLLFIIPFLSVIGLMIAIISYKKKKFKGFARIGILINSLVCLWTVGIIVINSLK
jgi:ABC-type sugar transport system permease subunit